jgi:hypothetical protein
MTHDIHVLTAACIYNKSPEDVTSEERTQLFGGSIADLSKIPDFPPYVIVRFVHEDGDETHFQFETTPTEIDGRKWFPKRMLKSMRGLEYECGPTGGVGSSVKNCIGRIKRDKGFGVPRVVAVYADPWVLDEMIEHDERCAPLQFMYGTRGRNGEYKTSLGPPKGYDLLDVAFFTPDGAVYPPKPTGLSRAQVIVKLVRAYASLGGIPYRTAAEQVLADAIYEALCVDMPDVPKPTPQVLAETSARSAYMLREAQMYLDLLKEMPK